MKALIVISISAFITSLTHGKEGGLNEVPAPSLGMNPDQVSAFDDTVLYKIKFNEENDKSLPESLSSKIKDVDNIDILSLNEQEESENVVWIRTKNQETYYCVIPSLTGQEPETSHDVSETKELLEPLSPYELIKPLIDREVCSYRLEQYWTYELCHGRYLRQFHEESVLSKKAAKGQEYILGKFETSTQFAATEKEFSEKLLQLKEKGMKPPTISIEGNSLPFIEFNFTAGTLCDVNNKPRITRVLYVCSENSKHELHSIKEIFTCEYEAIVLSPMLCLNKNYQKKSVIEHDIRCFPVGVKTPSKPQDVTEFEAGIRSQSKSENIFDGKTVIFDAAELTPEGVKIQVQIHDPEGTFENLWNPSKEGFSPSAMKAKMMKHKLSSTTKVDAALISDFLTGELCLHGGTGWWKYEFCYGKKVEQYHEEAGEKMSKVTLGFWDHASHVKWISDNPEKKPKRGKTPKMVSHYYSKGDICPDTGKARSVEVKLKCKFLAGGSPDSISLYLLEPHTCDYILGIESPFLCQLLNHIDENGLIATSGVVSDVLSEDEETDNSDLLSKPDKTFIQNFMKIMDKINQAEDEDDEEEVPPKTSEKKHDVRDEL